MCIFPKYPIGQRFMAVFQETCSHNQKSVSPGFFILVLQILYHRRSFRYRLDGKKLEWLCHCCSCFWRWWLLNAARWEINTNWTSGFRQLVVYATYVCTGGIIHTTAFWNSHDTYKTQTAPQTFVDREGIGKGGHGVTSVDTCPTPIQVKGANFEPFRAIPLLSMI